MTIYNFCAGPAMLPIEVMQQAQAELVNWQNTGSSVMEISHRSKEFIKVYEDSIAALRALLSIPDNYSVLYMQGGGRGQFSAVPLNLRNENSADYFNTGSWSTSAVSEAKQFTSVTEHTITNQLDGKTAVMPMADWSVAAESAYVHYCPNETIEGIEIFETPKNIARPLQVPIIADMSSTILSRQIDIKDYDLIYAGAQKNIGPSGLAIVIIKNDLLARSKSTIPSLLNYQLTQQKQSMFNTPPTFAIYLAGKVFNWLLDQGGIAEIEKKNIVKAKKLYETIDNSDLYHNSIHPTNRSRMNVTFTLRNSELTERFVQQAELEGLKALKGHRSVGGIRASIYNAMPIEGVDALVSFMKNFERQGA